MAVEIDELAQEIRRVDGNNSLGAGALAEALMPFLAALRPSPSSDERVKVREVGWLIEINEQAGPTYFQLVVDDQWTRDSLAALRFARKQDAEAYINDIGWTRAVAVEHMWLDPSGDLPGDERVDLRDSVIEEVR